MINLTFSFQYFKRINMLFTISHIYWGTSMCRFLIRNLPTIVLIVSMSLLIAGIYLNEPRRVFNAAISICLACIGIG